MRLYPLALVCAVTAFAATPVLAESSHPDTSKSSEASKSDASKSNMTNMQQSLKQDLEKAGFKDISVSPASFSVHATNSGGDKVFMLVGPESMTEFVSAQSSHSDQSGSSKSTSSK